METTLSILLNQSMKLSDRSLPPKQGSITLYVAPEAVIVGHFRGEHLEC